MLKYSGTIIVCILIPACTGMVLLLNTKIKFMPNSKTDSRGFTTESPDVERDNGAKGGPGAGLGIPDSTHGISHPYNADLQTQIVAKSKKKKSNVVTTK